MDTRRPATKTGVKGHSMLASSEFVFCSTTTPYQATIEPTSRSDQEQKIY